jgi:hypothetical protein
MRAMFSQICLFQVLFSRLFRFHAADNQDASLCQQRFKCQNKKCIDRDLLCDRVNHCGDYTDEQPDSSSQCKVKGIHPTITKERGDVHSYECNAYVHETFIPMITLINQPSSLEDYPEVEANGESSRRRGEYGSTEIPVECL